MMLRSFSRQSLLLQFAALIGALLVLGTIALVTMRNSLGEAQALEHARVTASMVEALGNWSSQYRGVWVLSEPTETSFQVGDFLEHRQARPSAISSGADKASVPVSGTVAITQTGGTFHHKDPSHVQRELSAVVEKMGGVERFRVTSDRVFDLRNTPNRFELTAIEQLRSADPANAEYHEVSGDRLVYAKRLVATASCLACHDTPERSPEAIRNKFTGSQGWGFKEGGFAGIVSVSVPIRGSGAGALFQQMNLAASLAVTATLLTFGALLYWLRANVIHAAQVLKDYAQRILEAKAGEKVTRVDLDIDEHSSRNEMHRLSVAIKALYRALLLAQADRV
ncbi:MAG: DUF3365 domain-containing protein [Burkholderiales bacterium]|nr:DUF3365 domain-containing protein [Burkholderiales bacterium]